MKVEEVDGWLTGGTIHLCTLFLMVRAAYCWAMRRYPALMRSTNSIRRVFLSTSLSHTGKL